MSSIATFHVIPYRTRNIVTVVGFAITVASWWLFIGPYAWLAELQISVMGAYYPTITGLLVLLPVLFILLLPFRQYHLRRGTLSPKQMAADRAYDERLAGLFNLWRVKGLILAMAMLCAGAVSGFSAWSAGALTTPTLQQLHELQYESRFVALPTERLVYDDSLYLDDAATDWLVPLDTGRSEYSVFVRIHTDAGQSPDEALMDGTGLIESLGLDGQVRATFNEYGSPTSPKTIIVNLGGSPVEEAEMSTLLLTLGMAFLVVVGVAQLLVMRQREATPA